MSAFVVGGGSVESSWPVDDRDAADKNRAHNYAVVSHGTYWTLRLPQLR